MPFNRFLPPEYEDGIDTVRGSVQGGPLSSARFVSLLVHGSRESEAPVTLMLAQWGQFIDHDLTSTAQPRSVNGSVPRCCGPNDFHPSCLPIKVPLDDPWLAPLKVRCLEFLRSAPAQRRDCVLSWREQTNQATSYLDASPVYSSNARISDSARVFRNGLLVFGKGNPSEDVCLRGALDDQCVKPGDGRSGEQPGLLAMHHVWVGEHNRIATELNGLNPHWSDEKVYQETRRIVGAMFQHITYREFLPLVVGREVCKLFDLELLESGYYTNYDPQINPTVANSFAAAAFRFGHSLVQGTYMRCDKNHNFLDNNVSLHDELSKGDLGSPGSLHRLLRGLATQRAQKRDEFITAELTNHLFQSGSFPFGLDLAAINIQRGRDHGIPPYTAWREPCGLSPITGWSDLENIIGPASTKRISHAYQSVHDIDLFVGGIAERPVIGGLVGPTFACIIAQQFSNLRKGDRFWYENSGFESSFTPAQLHSIRRVSLAQVVCRSLGGGTIQPHILVPHEALGNDRIACGVGLLEPIDILPWLEQDPFSEKSIPGKSPNSNEFNTTSQLLNNVDFIPNGSTGLTRPTQHNTTKINNKLDLIPLHNLTPKQPPKHIHSKIDNKKRKTANTKTETTLPTKKPQDFTTRRTVIINNVPLILQRSIDETQIIPQIGAKGNNTISSAAGHDSIFVEIDHAINNNSLVKNLDDHAEQRQYSQQTIYGPNKQQKLVIPAPDTDEYEIEINIRQTNNNRRQNLPNSITSKYDDYNTISTPFSYRPSKIRPNNDQLIDYNPQTKPPKIIYLNEQDDYNRQTTPQPNILQTIFTVGTNSIIEHFQKPNPLFSGNLLNGNGFFGGSGPNGGSGSNSGSSSSSSGAPINAVSSNSDFNGAVNSASSSSSSNSNTFNINIRPAHPNIGLSQHSTPSSYGLVSNSHRNPSSNSQYSVSLPRPHPFSTNNYPPYQTQTSTQSLYNFNGDYDYYQLTAITRRPYYRPSNNYYPRNKEQSRDSQTTIEKDLTDSTDYDITTYIPILNENDTTTDDYYDDTEGMDTKFDQDGYLRPEHMILDILNHNIDEKLPTTTTNRNISKDDFVLPALTETEELTKPAYTNITTYSDAIPRRPAFEILAEDYEDIAQPKIKKKVSYAQIPFAPLNVLTKPERPDHWVIYDEPNEKDPLPSQPELNTDTQATGEFPKPIASINNKRLRSGIIKSFG